MVHLYSFFTVLGYSQSSYQSGKQMQATQLFFVRLEVEEIPDVPDPESRRHRAAKAKVDQDSKTLPNELQKTQDNCEMM